MLQLPKAYHRPQLNLHHLATEQSFLYACWRSWSVFCELRAIASSSLVLSGASHHCHCFLPIGCCCVMQPASLLILCSPLWMNHRALWWCSTWPCVHAGLRWEAKRRIWRSFSALSMRLSRRWCRRTWNCCGLATWQCLWRGTFLRRQLQKCVDLQHQAGRYANIYKARAHLGLRPRLFLFPFLFQAPLSLSHTASAHWSNPFKWTMSVFAWRDKRWTLAGCF